MRQRQDLDSQREAPRFAGTLYSNGVLFVTVGIPLALVGVVVGLAGDFWWLLWAGMAVSALGISLWLIGSAAIAPIFASLFWWFGIAVALVGLILGLASGFWILLWIGIGLSLTAWLAWLCAKFLRAESSH